MRNERGCMDWKMHVSCMLCLLVAHLLTPQRGPWPEVRADVLTESAISLLSYWPTELRPSAQEILSQHLCQRGSSSPAARVLLSSCPGDTAASAAPPFSSSGPSLTPVPAWSIRKLKGVGVMPPSVSVLVGSNYMCPTCPGCPDLCNPTTLFAGTLPG